MNEWSCALKNVMPSTISTRPIGQLVSYDLFDFRRSSFSTRIFSSPPLLLLLLFQLLIVTRALDFDYGVNCQTFWDHRRNVGWGLYERSLTHWLPWQLLDHHFLTNGIFFFRTNSRPAKVKKCCLPAEVGLLNTNSKNKPTSSWTYIGRCRWRRPTCAVVHTKHLSALHY